MIRQTPGGLKNTVECRLFRQKLLQRPLALRCGTEYVQPHEMCRIVDRYLDGPCDSPSHQLKQLLANDDPSDSEHITAVTQLWCEIFDNEETWLTTSVKSIMHAVSDIGALVEWLQPNIEFGHDSANNLEVLHNQNRVVDDFGLSAWVTQSKRQVISRSVTSCAGMTAFMVGSQTKVGFLTGGRDPRRREAYAGRRGIYMLEQQLPLLVPAKCVSSFAP